MFPILLALAALAYCLVLHRRLAILKEDLRYVHRSFRAHQDQTEQALRDLKAQLAAAPKPAAVNPATPSWFSPYMTIQDALNLHAGVKEVLAGLHIGGCSSCSVSSKETLEQAAAGHGVDLAEMLSRLNALMDGAPAPEPAAPEPSPSPLAAAEKALPPPNGGRVMLAVGEVPKR